MTVVTLSDDKQDFNKCMHHMLKVASMAVIAVIKISSIAVADNNI